MFIENKCDQKEALALLGGLFCNIGKMVGVAFWSKNTEFTSNFGKTDLDTIIQNSGFIGGLFPDAIENNDTDATYKESIMKIRSQVDLGRKGFNLTFEKSPCFHNELNKLNNSEDYGFTPIMDDGSLFAYKTSTGTRKPFPAKLFVGTFKLPIQGVEDKGTIMGVDLLPKALDNWQNNGVIISNDEIDFREVNPVAGLNIVVPILTAGATTTSIKVTNLCSSAPVLGLTEASNWKVRTNGVMSSPSAISYDANTQEYKLTHAALVANDKVAFVTSKNGRNIYIVDTNYYSGASMEKTVV